MGCRLYDSENQIHYEGLFESLKERGLGIPDLVISDGHTGIREAVLKCFPGSAWQYCHVHFMRNMMKRIPRKHWSGIGIVKQALENPDLLPIAQEHLMRNNMKKAADMFDRWHSSL